MICLDTDMLISLMNNNEETKKWFLLNDQERLATTSISAYEVLYGACLRKGAKSLQVAQLLLSKFQILDISYEHMVLAAQISAELENKGQRIQRFDVFIATICIEHNVPLKTMNKKYFERIGGLVLA